MEKQVVLEAFRESARAKESFFTEKNVTLLIEAARMVTEAFMAGNKLMLIGNGGSAADAQHIAAEFINRYRIERGPLPALALTTDTSDITSIGNDYSFDLIFSKQLRALGKPGDVLLAISTSGNSRNVVEAVNDAKRTGIKTIALTGCGGGALANKADILLNVDSNVTPRIQEVHITASHVICELVDHMLFSEAAPA